MVIPRGQYFYIKVLDKVTVQIKIAVVVSTQYLLRVTLFTGWRTQCVWAVSHKHFKFKSHSGEKICSHSSVTKRSICQVRVYLFNNCSSITLMLFPLVTQIGGLEWIDCIFSYTICLYGWQSEVKAITHQVHSGHLSCNITGILSHWILGIAFQI